MGRQGKKSDPYARICTACQALGRPGDAACPVCGAAFAARRAPRRGGGTLLPAHARATAILISINAGLMALILATRGVGETRSPFQFLSPSVRALDDFGARMTPAILDGEVWRLVTAMYLHGGLLHLLFNTMALRSLGMLIEAAFGGRKLFAIYTVSGVAGFVVSTFVGGHLRSVGASGAIFGLLGFAFVYSRYRGGAAGRAVADQLMVWILYGAVMLFSPGIDNFAHAGGFAAGAGFGLLMTPGEPRTLTGERVLKVLHALLVLMTVAAFAAMVQGQFAARAS